MDHVIELDGVAVDRGGQNIWSEGTFAIPSGAVVGVIGSNGSGKTTLLEMLVGTLAPTEGVIKVLGQSPSQANSQIGYVPQSYVTQIGDSVRAYDLVALGLTGTRWGWHRLSAQDQQAIADALADVDATGYSHKRVSELSGGQQQRIAIAQALVSKPKLLLLDEPLANLDLRKQRDVVQLLGQLSADKHLTVLVVAHDLNPLLNVLTGAIYLLDGHAHYDEINNVVDEELLSHLYGTAVKVIKTPQGDLFTSNA